MAYKLSPALSSKFSAVPNDSPASVVAAIVKEMSASMCIWASPLSSVETPISADPPNEMLSLANAAPDIATSAVEARSVLFMFVLQIWLISAGQSKPACASLMQNHPAAEQGFCVGRDRFFCRWLYSCNI